MSGNSSYLNGWEGYYPVVNRIGNRLQIPDAYSANFVVLHGVG